MWQRVATWRDCESGYQICTRDVSDKMCTPNFNYPSQNTLFWFHFIYSFLSRFHSNSLGFETIKPPPYRPHFDHVRGRRTCSRIGISFVMAFWKTSFLSCSLSLLWPFESVTSDSRTEALWSYSLFSGYTFRSTLWSTYQRWLLVQSWTNPKDETVKTVQSFVTVAVTNMTAEKITYLRLTRCVCMSCRSL